MTDKQVQVLKAICDLVIEAVQESGDEGVPGGTLYAALMTFGCSLNQFEQIMAGLVKAGKLRKQGHFYFSK